MWRRAARWPIRRRAGATARPPFELARLADLVRQIPSARPFMEGIEERDFKVLSAMRAEEVLASEEALEAFKKAIAEAVRPPAACSGSMPPPE